MMHFCEIANLAAALNVKVHRRNDAISLWDSVLQRAKYVPFQYSNASIDYQLTYQRGTKGKWDDFSIVLEFDRSPVAVYPLSIAVLDGESVVNSHGLPVLPPLFAADCSPAARKRLTKLCLDIGALLAQRGHLSQWQSAESFNTELGLSHWHVESQRRGAKCTVMHELYVDLRQEIDAIRRQFRKSYRTLITSGARQWEIALLKQKNEATWKEFRALHFAVAGRQTRSDETWERHLTDIDREEAFLVYLRDAGGSMVGAGFFNVTRDEGCYSVAAYDRSLFAKPLGHVVQLAAIQELKRRSVVWYKLGARPYAQDSSSPSEKEISIGEFKSGFATHVFPRFYLTHPTVDTDV